MRNIKKKIIVFKVILLPFLFLSCTSPKQIKLLGFAYRGEKVIIKRNSEVLLSIKCEGAEDENGICSFNKVLKLSFKKQEIGLNIIIDSSNVKILDTIITIPKNSVEPFVSIIYPSSKTSFKRTLFLADAIDSNYIKY